MGFLTSESLLAAPKSWLNSLNSSRLLCICVLST